ncbi:hypothetical protein QTV43_000586 [Vibrio vulnificus]|nr:hypothetical protein [Vibrio vulnificus]
MLLPNHQQSSSLADKLNSEFSDDFDWTDAPPCDFDDEELPQHKTRGRGVYRGRGITRKMFFRDIARNKTKRQKAARRNQR